MRRKFKNDEFYIVRVCYEFMVSVFMDQGKLSRKKIVNCRVF